MHAIRCNQYGPPESLVLETVPDLRPGPDEALVEVRAASVNFPDVLIIQNKYQTKPELPFTPGAEFAGVVLEVGSKVSRIRPGMRVAAYVPHGAFAEQAVARESACIVLPDHIDFPHASAITLAYGTSHHAVVDRAALKPGETLLVLGAAGGVGLAAVEIGKAIGARVIAAASDAEKLALCVEHGADATIDYSNENLRDRIKALTGGDGPDVIFDPVGGEYSEAAFRSIKWRGRHLVVGFANGEIPKLPLNLTLLKGASVVGVFWGQHVQREPQLANAAMQQIVEWIREGTLRPHITRRYPLAQTAEALSDMAARRVSGKIVIEP